MGINGSFFDAEIMLTRLELEDEVLSQAIIREIKEPKQIENGGALPTSELDNMLGTFTAISSTLQIEEVLSLIAEHMIDLFKVSGCALYRWNPESKLLEIIMDRRIEAAAKFVDAESPFLNRVSPVVGVILENHLPILARVTDSDGDPVMIEYLKKRGIGSLLLLPLRTGDRVIGLAELENKDEREFSNGELALSQAFADQAAVVIENARLHTETQSRLRDQATLREAGSVISSTLDLDIVLTRLVEQICQEVNGTSAYILSYDRKTKTSIVLADYYGPEANEKEKLSDLGEMYSLEEGETESIDAGVIEEYHVDDPEISADERAHLIKYGGQTVVNIPLRIRGRITAFVELWDSRRKRIFTPEAIALSVGIAQQAAIAIENARLYEEAQQEIRERKRVRNELLKSRDELETRVQERTVDLAKANASLMEEIAERKRAENELRKISDDLEKRVKELNCLYEISTLFAIADIPSDQMLQKIADLIPLALQYPQIACVAISIEDTKIKTGNYKDTQWNLKSEIKVHSNPTGSLTICYLEETPLVEQGPFLPEEKNLIDAISERLGKNIEYRQAQHMMLRRGEELEAIARLSSALRDAETRAKLLLILIDQISNTFHAEISALALLDQGKLVLVATQGVDSWASGQEIPQSCEIFWTALESREPLFINTREEEVFNSTHRLMRQLFQDASNAAIIPLKTSDSVVGLLYLAYRNKEFSEDDRRILTAIADVAGIALYRTRVLDMLEERVSERTKDLAALYKITSITSEILDFKSRLDKYLTTSLGIMGSDAGFILLLDKREVQPEMLIQTGFSVNEDPRVDEWLIESGIWEHIVQEDRIVTIVESNYPVPLLEENQTLEFHNYIGIPIKTANKTVGTICLFKESNDIFTADEKGFIATIADQIGVAVERSQLRYQTENAILLQERQRLARELHDAVTQSLYSIRLFVDGGAIYAEEGDLEEVKQYFQEIEKISQQVIKEMRLLLYELRPLDFETTGLKEAFRQRLESVEQRANVETHLIYEQHHELPPGMQNGLYRIAQEALNNAIKHAMASSVTIKFSATKEKVFLSVEDNGIGFDIHSAYGGMGLSNMQERAQNLGGTLNIASSPEQGSMIKVILEEV